MCTGTRQNGTATRGTLQRVAAGLYRYSTSDVYFAHVRIGGKLFRESLKTTDRKIADVSWSTSSAAERKSILAPGKVTLRSLVDRYDALLSRLRIAR